MPRVPIYKYPSQIKDNCLHLFPLGRFFYCSFNEQKRKDFFALKKQRKIKKFCAAIWIFKNTYKTSVSSISGPVDTKASSGCGYTSADKAFMLSKNALASCVKSS